MNQNCEPEFKKFVGLHLEEGRPAEVLQPNFTTTALLDWVSSDSDLKNGETQMSTALNFKCKTGTMEI